MATPTRLEVWSSRTLTATPRPEKNAMGIPHRKVVRVPRLSISSVGQELAIWVQEQQAGMITPKMTQMTTEIISFRIERLMRGRSQMQRPYAIPSTGPLSGWHFN